MDDKKYSNVPKRNRGNKKAPKTIESTETPKEDAVTSTHEEKVPKIKKSAEYKTSIYKEWWFWLIIVCVIATIAMIIFMLVSHPKKETNKVEQANSTTQVKKENSNKTSNSIKKSSSKTPTSNYTSTNPSTTKSTESSNKSGSNPAIDGTGSALKIFTSIQLGDTSQSGTGGTSLEELKKTLKNPNKQEDITYNGKPAIKATWGAVTNLTEGSGTMVIFDKNDQNYLAVSKTCVGISSNPRSSKIDLNEFNKLNVSTLSTVAAVKQFGQPNAMTLSRIEGKNFASYTWNSNIKGDQNSFMTISFTNDLGTTKAQQGMN